MAYDEDDQRDEKTEEEKERESITVSCPMCGQSQPVPEDGYCPLCGNRYM